MGVDFREFIGIYSNPNYLKHHGILGMKWGVRRYQNKNGTYTKLGLERYRKAQNNYETAKNVFLKTKTTGTHSDIKFSKSELRNAKRELNKRYDQLKEGYKADQGEKLYKKGKTISGNISKKRLSNIGLVTGAYSVNKVLSKYGDVSLSSISTPTIILGTAAVSAIIGRKTKSDNKKLRAYYARIGHIND